MSHYGRTYSADRFYGTPRSDTMNPASLHGRQPLSPISAQQQAMMEESRRHANSVYSKPISSHPGILPPASNAEFFRRSSDQTIDRFDDSRSISSVSSSFRTAAHASSFATPAFINAAHLDSSVSNWIDRSSPHFPNRGRSSQSAVPLLCNSSERAAGYPSFVGRDGVFPAAGGSGIAPSESGFASSHYPESVSGSSVDVASQLRQRHVNAGRDAGGDNDDACSVYTLASTYAPSIAPSVTPSVTPSMTPSAASLAAYQDAEENVEDVEMMELDESLPHVTKEPADDSCLSSELSDSDSMVANEVGPESSTKLPRKLLRADPFIREERGVVTKLVSALFRLFGLAVSAAARFLFGLFCLVLFLFIVFVCLYTCVYLWTHHAESAAAADPSSIDFAGIRAGFRDRLYGQPIAEKRILGALESLVESEDEHRRLLTFHGSTGVGKSHVVNVLKQHLPAGAVHILYPDLVVHDLEGRDESASAARSKLLRNWLSTRLAREAPFKMIVIENADKHPELLDEIAGAVKDAVDAHEAELLKSLDMRKDNGLTDALDGWIDWVFDVPKIVDASILLRRSKLLFVVVSNVGFRHVNALAYGTMRKLANDGKENESADRRPELDDGDTETIAATVEEPANAAIRQKESAFLASMLKTGMEPGLVAFLPLTKAALRRCLLADKEFVAAAAGVRVDEMIETVIAKAEFYPRNDPVFSVSGCKRLSSLLLS